MKRLPSKELRTLLLVMYPPGGLSPDRLMPGVAETGLGVAGAGSLAGVGAAELWSAYSS